MPEDVNPEQILYNLDYEVQRIIEERVKREPRNDDERESRRLDEAYLRSKRGVKR